MSVLDIFNQAINAVGVTRRVDTLTEKSTEARACASWYPRARRHVMRAAHWNCLRKVVYPALSVRSYLADDYTGTETAWTEDMPPKPWHYMFALPDDYVAARYINATPFPPFSVVANKRLCSDVKSPELVYTYDEENPEQWDDHFYMAVVYGLAMHVAVPLTAKRSMRADARQLANDLILDARVSDGNEIMVDRGMESQIIYAREHEPVDGTYYVAPYGPLFR